MNKYGIILLGLTAILFAGGCAGINNGFSQFYQDRVGSAITNFPAYSGNTRVASSSDLKSDFKDALRNGYWLIGESAFQGQPQSRYALMYQAKKVGADLVLCSSRYLGSQQVEESVLQYHPGETSTTTSSGMVNANAYGSGGYAYGTGNYYGTSTTTTPGTYSTQVVPVTVERYQYDAAFFRKAKSPPISGIVPQPLSPELREKLQRNTGVLVWVVRNDTPAFTANILEGDVILKVGGDDVISVDDYLTKMKEFAGQKVDFEISRDGVSKTISVQLNSVPN